MEDKKEQCPACEGSNPAWSSNYCNKHNVCIDCGIKRADLDDIPYGVREGAFQCKPCHEIDRIREIEERQSKGFEHEHTQEIVCPHCGYEYGDSWEYSDDGTQECGECYEGFTYTREVEVSYSTSK